MTYRTTRRASLTPEVHDQIIGLVRDGTYLTVAAAAIGITDRAIHKWLERGRAELERLDQAVTPYQRAQQGLPTETDEAKYVRFVLAFEEMRARAEIEIVGHIRKDIAGGWVKEKHLDPESGALVEVQAGPNGRLGLEFLSRVAPQRFGRRQQVEVSTEHSGTIQIEVTEASRIASRLEDFQRRLAANPAMLDAQADETFARRVIDVPSDRAAIGVGASESDTTDTDEEPGADG